MQIVTKVVMPVNWQHLSW